MRCRLLVEMVQPHERLNLLTMLKVLNEKIDWMDIADWWFYIVCFFWAKKSLSFIVITP